MQRGATSPDNKNDHDVWFHFDRLRNGGLEPCRYDKVHFTLDLRPRAPSKAKPGSKTQGNSKTTLLARATKVELIELEPTRSADVSIPSQARALSTMEARLTGR